MFLTEVNLMIAMLAMKNQFNADNRIDIIIQITKIQGDNLPLLTRKINEEEILMCLKNTT